MIAGVNAMHEFHKTINFCFRFIFQLSLSLCASLHFRFQSIQMRNCCDACWVDRFSVNECLVHFTFDRKTSNRTHGQIKQHSSATVKQPNVTYTLETNGMKGKNGPTKNLYRRKRKCMATNLLLTQLFECFVYIIHILYICRFHPPIFPHYHICSLLSLYASLLLFFFLFHFLPIKLHSIFFFFTKMYNQGVIWMFIAGDWMIYGCCVSWNFARQTLLFFLFCIFILRLGFWC